MDTPDKLVIARDTFLDQLDMAHAQRALGSAENRDLLYAMLSEHLQANGVAAPVAPEGGNAEMALKLPGLPLHLRLTDFSRDEINLFITAAAILAGTLGGGLAGIAVGVVSTLASRLRVLRARFGELCLIEALAEGARPTERASCVALLGKPCRRPDASCRFEQDGSVCGFDLASLQGTLRDMEARKLVHRLNAVEPIEYGVVV